MPRIMVHVSSTVGSTIRGSDADGWERDLGHDRDGWPVGWGHIDQTLLEDGGQAEALVLMREPALAGVDVAAWPVAVLHLAGGDPDEVLCVAEEGCFTRLVDETDLEPWHAGAELWAAALDRLAPDHRHRPVECGSRAEAEHIVEDARWAYLRSTGCLDEPA